MEFTVAKAQNALACRVLKVKAAWPVVPVVAVPDATTVPVQVEPEYTWSVTPAPLIGAVVDVFLAVTVRGTW